MKVPFFDYSRVYSSEREKVGPKIEEVLNRSDFILRSDLENFEQELAAYCKSEYMIGVANGTDAIWLALKAMGIGQGDEVILPSHTYVATADAITFVGATPVLVDCSEDHSISPEAIAEAISPRTTAIIPVNLNGRACELDVILAIAQKYRLFVIEDNAQGLGAKYREKSAGTFGQAGSLSFFPAKNLGCYGDGGGVLVQEENLAESLRSLRNHGRNRDGLVREWGYNSRLDNLQAAILSVKLKDFDQTVTRRREIASIYQHLLGEVEQLKLPPAPNSDARYFDSYQNYEIEADDRNSLMEYLQRSGVGFSLPWAGKAVHHFNLPGCITKELPQTNRLFEKILLLPMNQYLTNQEVEFVAKNVKKFYSER